MILYIAGKIHLPPKQEVPNMLVSFHYAQEGESQSKDFQANINQKRKKNAGKQKPSTKGTRKRRPRDH